MTAAATERSPSIHLAKRLARQLQRPRQVARHAEAVHVASAQLAERFGVLLLCGLVEPFDALRHVARCAVALEASGAMRNRVDTGFLGMKEGEGFWN